MHRSLVWTGFVLHILIGGLMLLAAASKLAGAIPAEVVAKMLPGIRDNLLLIGLGEAVTAVLLIVPRTAGLGVLLTSSFWGGVICVHMAQQESYLMGAVLLVLTWIAGVLREPGLLGGLTRLAGERR